MARTRLIRLTRRAQAALDASLDAGAVAKQGGEGVSEGVEDVRFRYNPAADVLAVERFDMVVTPDQVSTPTSLVLSHLTR